MNIAKANEILSPAGRRAAINAQRGPIEVRRHGAVVRVALGDGYRVERVGLEGFYTDFKSLPDAVEFASDENHARAELIKADPDAHVRYLAELYNVGTFRSSAVEGLGLPLRVAA